MKATIKSVPEAGIEPALPYGKQILSLSCLPIPPLDRNYLRHVPYPLRRPALANAAA